MAGEVYAKEAAMSTTMTFRPDIRTLEEQPVAVITVTTTLGGIRDAIGDAFQELETVMKESGQDVMAGPPFARYLTFGQQLTFEAGFPIQREFPVTGRVKLTRLPGGPVATTVHVGPYERLSTTYGDLNAWVAAQGRTPAGPMWEVYLTDPEQEPDPERWRTEVFIPIR
jgi:effector-binding domain-containing protein